MNTHASQISASVSGLAKACNQQKFFKDWILLFSGSFEMLMALITLQVGVSFHPHPFPGTEWWKEHFLVLWLKCMGTHSPAGSLPGEQQSSMMPVRWWGGLEGEQSSLCPHTSCSVTRCAGHARAAVRERHLGKCTYQSAECWFCLKLSQKSVIAPNQAFNFVLKFCFENLFKKMSLSEKKHCRENSHYLKWHEYFISVFLFSYKNYSLN